MSVVLYRGIGTSLDLEFQDGTHHKNYGSYELAKRVAKGIRGARIDLANFLTDEIKVFDPAQPNSSSSFKVPPSGATSPAKPEGN